MSESREFKISLDNVWIEYDEFNDILYINFCDKREEAEETILLDDNIVAGIKGNRVISLTIMNLLRK